MPLSLTHRDLIQLTAAPQPFDRADWVYELKYDGFRVMAGTRPAPVMLSRQGRDMAGAFPDLTEELAGLPDLVLDGELVVLDARGLPQFEELRRRALMSRPIAIAHAARSKPAAIMAFDLLMLNGKDTRTLPLLKRKTALERALKDGRRILFAKHVGEHGGRLYAKALQLELEGIVAKSATSQYVAGRSRNWVKIKTPAGRAREHDRMKHLRDG